MYVCVCVCRIIPDAELFQRSLDSLLEDTSLDQDAVLTDADMVIKVNACVACVCVCVCVCVRMRTRVVCRFIVIGV